MASIIFEKATIIDSLIRLQISLYTETMELSSSKFSYVCLPISRYASAITCYFVIFYIAFIECSMTVNDHTTALNDIFTYAPLSQIEKALGWMFCQRAEFSRFETHLVLFTLREINEVFQLPQAIDDKLLVFLPHCRWA